VRTLRPLLVVALFCLLPAVASAGNASVVAVHPNPLAAGDAGEFVVVDARNATLSDGESEIRVTGTNGTVVLSPDPAAARNLTDRRPVRKADIALANGGEELVLSRDGRTLAETGYENAPEGETLHNGTWRAPGATTFAPVRARNAAVSSFVLPDTPGPALDALESADSRLLLGAYTLTSERVTDRLLAAHERGVDVRVLAEGGPVGGMTRRGAARLDALAAAGVPVRVVAGPGARQRFHHAKYAVIDDRALVTSENWKRSGVGGGGTRGWGAVVGSPAVADRLAAAFRADSQGRNSVAWPEYRAKQSFRASNRSDATYPTRFDTRRGRANATLLLAPDNAESAVLNLLAGAEEELLVEQMSVDRGSPLYGALIDAAERGVRVRVALSGAWYNREENRRVVDALNGRAENGSLPIEAKLVEPRSRFSAVHVKGALVDGERALVGSLNWNNVSARENREAALVIEGREATAPYRRAFRADWRGGVWRVPLGAVLVVSLCGALVAVALGRATTFGNGG
jgi:phosphatidylserine/phosphatidylglycerophosphate/cardiolipin synthase-like enzyme